MKTPRIDTWQVEAHLKDFILDHLQQAKAVSMVVGVSGGLDSAATAFLARETVGWDKVQALILPYHHENSGDVEDALEVCRRLKIRYRIVDIGPSIDAYYSRFSRASVIRRGNKMARERMSILYDWAAYQGGLVLGTSNRTELLLGYFTKFGDGAADLEPLGGLYKCEVRQLAASLGVPKSIINKPPSAGLWKGQSDEKEIGIPYSILDSFLHCWLDLGLTGEELLKEGFSPQTISQVTAMVRGSEHKRRTPPVPLIAAEWRKTE